MKQDERSITRKRTQQLVYLELGRDNGGVMLNLSEQGCGFQAISPVKLGKTRFAFQISGGRRIAGEGNVEWVDDAGIMGGLRFASLTPEARKQIRMWLTDTNAPEELGDGVLPATAPPPSAETPAFQPANGGYAAASSGSSRPTQPQAGVRVAEAEAPLSPPWANLTATLPNLEEERARFPLLQGDGSYHFPRRKARGTWRTISALMTLAAVGTLAYVYQKDVGTSLIWVGETLAGKTKASSTVPETTPEIPASSAADAQAPATSTAPSVSEPSAASQAAATAEADATPKKTPEVTQGGPHDAAQSNAVLKSIQRPESVLEQQPTRQKVDPPIEGESVESLWGAVQAGSVAAEMSLAERFVRGDGVIRNCDQARVLMRAAANKGNREARLRLYELESGACQ